MSRLDEELQRYTIPQMYEHDRTYVLASGVLPELSLSLEAAFKAAE